MPDFVSERRVRAGRKKCWCHDCLDDIEIGQPRLVRMWADGGEIYPWNTCAKCEEFLDAAHQWMGKANRIAAERLDEVLGVPHWDDGYRRGWLRERFVEGDIEIAGLVIRDRAAAASYLKELIEQQNQGKAR